MKEYEYIEISMASKQQKWPPVVVGGGAKVGCGVVGTGVGVVVGFCVVVSGFRVVVGGEVGFAVGAEVVVGAKDDFLILTQNIYSKAVTLIANEYLEKF